MIHFSLLGAVVGGAFSPVVTFQALPISGGGISGNGQVIVGSAFRSGFYYPCVWTKNSGLKYLPVPEGCKGGFADNASYDGSVVVGIVDKSGTFYVCKWTKGGRVMQLLGKAPVNAQPTISSDGFTIASGGHRIWREHKPERFVKTLIRDAHCGVSGMSAGGNVIVGLIEVGYKNPLHTPGQGLRVQDGSIEACVWKGESAPIRLGRPGDYFTTQAVACTADGALVCGFGSALDGDRPFIWSVQKGLVRLPVPPNSLSVTTSAISANGDIIFGERQTEARSYIMYWRKSENYNVVRTFESLLQMSSINSSGWEIHSVQGLASDGRTMVVTGFKDGLEPQTLLLTVSPW